MNRLRQYFREVLKPLHSLERVDLLLFASIGGHLDQLLDLESEFAKHNYLIIVNDNPPEREILKRRCLKITHGERDVKQALNIIECLLIIQRTRPKAVLSTGAAPAVWLALFGKAFGSKIIFIESIARVETLSMTGRIVKLLADDFYVQWPALAAKVGARYSGVITTASESSR